MCDQYLREAMPRFTSRLYWLARSVSASSSVRGCMRAGSGVAPSRHVNDMATEKSLALSDLREQHSCPISKTVVQAKRPQTTRRIWRMTPSAPLGELVDFDPTEAAGGHAGGPLKVLDPAPVVDWRGSSFDLLNGVEVRDHSNSIPGELFDRLFKR